MPTVYRRADRHSIALVPTMDALGQPVLSSISRLLVQIVEGSIAQLA